MSLRTSRLAGCLVLSLACLLSAAARAGGAPPATTTLPATSSRPAATQPAAAGLPEGAIQRLGSGAFRHAGRVMTVDMTPDGRRIASAGADGKVCVWDRSGAKLAEITAARGVVALALSADGNTVWYASNDGTVAAASVAGGEPRLLRTDQRITKAEFSADRTMGLSSAMPGAAQLWRVSDGNTVAQPEQVQGYCNALAIAPDKKRFATAGLNSQAGGYRVEVWDANSGQALWSYGAKTENPQPALALAYSPDGNTLAAAFQDKIVLLGARDGSEGLTLSVARATDLTFLSGGKELLAATDQGILIVDAKGGGKVRQIGPKDYFSKAVASADGSVIAAAGRGQSVSIYDGRSGAARKMSGHQRPIRSLAFSRDGGALLSASEDGTVRRWGLAEGNDVVLAQAEGQNIQFMAISADLSAAVLFHYSNQPQTGISMWDLKANQARATFSVPQGHRMAALSPDGQLLAAGGYGGLDLWQGRTGKLVARLDVPGEPRGAAAKVAQRITWMHSAGAFSPDGGVFASAGIGVRFYELASGEGVAEERLPSAVSALAFAPGGRSLAVYLAPDGPISLYDLATMKPAATLVGKIAGVTALAFSRDGRRLAAGMADTTILVFEVPPAAPTSQPASQPDAEALAALWEALASAEADKAWAAEWSLVSSGEPAVTLLRERLKPVPKPDKAPDVAALIVRLDHENFRVRDAAMKDLSALGRSAHPALREALAKTASDEVRARATEILADADDPRVSGAEALRAARAVRILELIGIRSAQELLAALAAGGPARLTDDAAAALARVKAR